MSCLSRGPVSREAPIPQPQLKSALSSSLLGKGLTSCLALAYPPLWQISPAAALGAFVSKRGGPGLCLSVVPELGLGTGIGLGRWRDAGCEAK